MSEQVQPKPQPQAAIEARIGAVDGKPMVLVGMPGAKRTTDGVSFLVVTVEEYVTMTKQLHQHALTLRNALANEPNAAKVDPAVESARAAGLFVPDGPKLVS